MKPVVCGVYLLFKEHELVYIGKSQDLYKRISSHRLNGREFDYAALIPLPESDLSWVESSLIKSFDSLKNKNKQSDLQKTRIEFFSAPKTGSIENQYQKKTVPQIMSVMAATEYVRTTGWSFTTALKEAVKNGELPSVVVGKDGKGNLRRKVLTKDVEIWCNIQLGKLGFPKEVGFQPREEPKND